MTETFFSLVAEHGIWVVLLSAFFSCLAVPVPTAIVMLAAGALVESGELVGWQVLAVAWGGAVAGDQTGFRIGRLGDARLNRYLTRNPERARIYGRAQRTLQRWGGPGVFFSTWLFAPLGPWVNLAAGITGLNWLRFTLWDMAGEAIWVTFYLGMGYSFSEWITELAVILSNWSGFLASGAVAVGLGLMLRRALRRKAARRGGPAPPRSPG